MIVRMPKIYVASSWRNPYQPMIVERLQEMGYAVYDFKNPAPGDNGFSWREIDPEWKNWDAKQLIKGLAHPIADHGFGLDMDALIGCDYCVCVLPCGRSAHLELGQAVGAGKKTIVLLDDTSEPELMYKMCSVLVTSIEEVIEFIEADLPLAMRPSTAGE